MHYLYAVFIGGWIVLIGAQALRTRDLCVIGVACIGALYPIGETLQGLLIGPSWVRWHLSDFGFTCYFALFFAIGIPLSDGKAVSKRHVLFWASFGLVLGLVSEATQFATGDGDWIDIWCFIASYIIVLPLVWGIRHPAAQRVHE